ncbi:Gfo/Idh/MocA family protein [Vibrio mangrovi]|uniref:1,5-anhydro-D-fructose reductase n=1 Tax=Vibrio mangrovi TaxID=474394 RepID=A0A1Y6IX24_9VIBR|nr:Gfo/Idh/MocA family oxidoreductase [Vibrio mangrovi]MDW6005353.1 Gfo/Idh/MocA family oxidoreductase [Vibrio mangrovi]SMS02207.1 1,5-anhydro-D-fructose reductase [Vibrio mangrovi]
MENHKVRWGIAGLGNIAHRFAADLTHYVQNGELYAVAARDLPRAAQFAGEYACPHYYDSYQALAADPNVDAVYIATLHPFHRHMTELFLRHGKHVLVEKPAFTNLRDWDEMTSLARQQGVLLVEAMKSVAFPAYQVLRQFIQQNQVTIHSVEAAFGGRHGFDSRLRIFDPDLSGGATLDVGVYALWLYADLCQLTQTPLHKPAVKYIQDYAESKVDDHVEFHFTGALEGKIAASISRDLQREATILGPELEIVIHDKWWNPKTIDIVYQGKTSQITTPAGGGGFEYETEHVSALILDGKRCSDVLRAETSRQVIAMMETALTENGFGHLVYPA